MRLNLLTILMVAVFLSGGLLIFKAYRNTMDTPHTQNLYKIWIKAHPKHKSLTFSEWLTLRNNYLLPYQQD